MTNLATIPTTPAPLARPANPFEPSSIDEAMRLADLLAKSALVPSPLRGKPADVFIILATGRELGIGPMQALSDINVIQGKPVYSADLMVAQCKRKPEVCKYIRLVESTEAGATYETHRVGAPEPERFSFTIDDARKLGLTDKDNYRKQPKTMLRRRAAAQLAREVYPDLVRGYDPDEAEDFSRSPRHEPPPAADATPPAHTQQSQAPASQQTVEVQAKDEKPADAAPPKTLASTAAVTQLWNQVVKENDGDKKAAKKVWAAAAEKAGADPVSAKWTPDDLARVYDALYPAPAPEKPLDDVPF